MPSCDGLIIKRVICLEHQAVQHILVGVDDAEMIAVGIVDTHEALGHCFVTRNRQRYMTHGATEVQFHAGMKEIIS